MKISTKVQWLGEPRQSTRREAQWTLQCAHLWKTNINALLSQCGLQPRLINGHNNASGLTSPPQSSQTETQCLDWFGGGWFRLRGGFFWQACMSHDILGRVSLGGGREGDPIKSLHPTEHEWHQRDRDAQMMKWKSSLIPILMKLWNQNLWKIFRQLYNNTWTTKS